MMQTVNWRHVSCKHLNRQWATYNACLISGLLPLVFIACTLSGCTTVSTAANLPSDDCATIHWQTLGYQDGQTGLSNEIFRHYGYICSKRHEDTDMSHHYQAWQQGFIQGRQRYCTISNAYQIGLNNQILAPVCHVAISATLKQANADGRLYYSLSKQIGVERAQIEKYNTAYHKIENEEHSYFTDNEVSQNNEARHVRLLQLKNNLIIIQQRLKRLIQMQKKLQTQYLPNLV